MDQNEYARAADACLAAITDWLADVEDLDLTTRDGLVQIEFDDGARYVVNRQGEEIGRIERVVTRNDRQYAVLASGGILGLGEQEVALPLDRLSMSAENKDRFVLLGMTEDDLAELPDFDMNSVRQVEPNQSVEIRQG